MGNNPSKPDNKSSSSSSPTTTSHGQPTGSNAQRRGHSRRETASSTSQQPDSPSALQAHSLSPPRKPSLKPQNYTPASAGLSAKTGMGNAQSHEKQDQGRRDIEGELHSGPVQVPVSAQQARRRTPDPTLEPSAPPNDPDYVPMSNLNFPPRLPLPIQEEVYTPGSPIITPDDLSTALREDVEGELPRQTSLLSHTTLDDDEEVELLDQGEKGKTVPTHIRWSHGGNRVYVTGTFANWGKKYRMHRNTDNSSLSTTLDLPPGTHHVKFIVDGEMHLSTELPTAVDYTNILVNYIEVSADDIPKEEPDVHPPMVLPPGVQATDFEPEASKEEPEEKHQIISTKDVRYGQMVPRYLNDLDRDPKSHRFQRAANHVQDIPTPPSLPLFLSKSILNGTMPMKDDSSVLNMPNHTVLNHLATSSIKSEVLATSLTTRYKRKYVTTIIYRATTDDDHTTHSNSNSND